MIGESDTGYEDAEAVAVLRPICTRLEPRDRRILFLRFFRGWTQSEIAADLGISQMHVSRLLSRILQSLRDQIDDGGDAPNLRKAI